MRRSADCGNSPKNRFAEEYVIALLMGDESTLKQASAVDLCVQQIPGEKPSNIEIEHVVTHGKVGAVNGTVVMDGGHQGGFCFVLVFASVKADRVAKITRYSS